MAASILRRDNMHPLCLDFLTAIEASPPELADLAAANGCQAISFMVHPVAGVPDFGMAGDTPMRRETRRRCTDLGIVIDMVEGFLLTAETDVAAFRPSLESAAWLGAGCANILLRDDDIARLTDNFAAFCNMAEACRVAVITEWSIRAPLKSPAEAAEFLARTGLPARLQFDSLHVYRAGFTASDIAALDSRVIARAQLSDGPAEMPPDRQFAEAIGDRLVPGEGALPLREFLAALPEGRKVGLEVPSQTLRDQGVGPAERVRRVVDGARRLLA
jgi:sugar phosphate isomerase/epimerase